MRTRSRGNVLAVAGALLISLALLLASPHSAFAAPPATEVFARVAPSVAVVETLNGHGTGFLLDPTHVMTDAHVVENFDTVKVRFPDGASFPAAKVVVRDRLVDMAVIELPTAREVTAKIVPPPTQVGAELYVLGYPGRTSSAKQPIFSRGLVSALTSWDAAGMSYVRTDASAEQGTSGGPILDGDGNIVAVIQFGSTQGAYAIGASAADLQARALRYLRGEIVDGLAARTPSGANAVSFDVRLQGAADPEESFFVTPSVDGTIQLAFEASRFTSTVAVSIVDPDGQWLAGGIMNGAKRTLSLTSKLTARRTYWVSLTSDAPASVAMRSSIAMARFVDSDDAQAAVGRIVGIMDHPADVDCRPIPLRAGQSVTARAESVAFDPLVYIVSPGGVVVAANEGNGEGVRGSDAQVQTMTRSDGDFVVCVGATDDAPPAAAYILTIDASRPAAVAPSAGSFVLGGARLATARTSNFTLTLRDGRVMTIDGLDADGVPLDTAEIYDPATGLVTVVGARDVVARRDVSATVLRDGRVLVVGGATAKSVTAAASVYNPTDGTWVAVGSLGEARIGAEVMTLDDGRVLVATGTGTFASLRTAELFDPRTGQFTSTGSMTAARSGLVSSKLLDGRVLIAGGVDANQAVLNSAEIYDPKSGRFTATGSLVTGRYNHNSTLLPSGQVLITGGAIATSGATLTGSGTLSGAGVNTVDLASAELYDPATGTFTATGAMQFAREAHSATALPDGRVLVVSGSYRIGSSRTVFVEVGAAELYNPATGRFSPAGSMRVARQQFGTALADGTAVFMGGSTEAATLDSVEWFRPGAAVAVGDGTFRATPIFSANGTAFAIFGGGGVDQLMAAARKAGAGGVWMQDANGLALLLVIDGPAFVVDTFRNTFADGIAPSTSVTLTR